MIGVAAVTLAVIFLATLAVLAALVASAFLEPGCGDGAGVAPPPTDQGTAGSYVTVPPGFFF
jgi:hypothetical protein